MHRPIVFLRPLGLRLIKTYQKETSYGENPYIDPLVRPICSLFNQNGFYTIGSCSGHIKANKKIDKKSNKHSRLDSGGIQFVASRENMRFIYHFINEFKNISPFRVELFVCTLQNELFKKHGLKNYLLIDYYSKTNQTTDNDLYLFHRLFYSSFKEALNHKNQYILNKAGKVFDRHAPIIYANKHNISVSEIPKTRFEFDLEELEWDED